MGASILIGAIIGAGVGAGTAAITGGDVGKGALWGAAGGAAGAGIGGAFAPKAGVFAGGAFGGSTTTAMVAGGALGGMAGSSLGARPKADKLELSDKLGTPAGTVKAESTKKTATPIAQLSERERKRRIRAASFITKDWGTPKLGKPSLIGEGLGSARLLG